eukprot:scaffold4455_cov132-Isochrysis_galbana.AAC.6
MASSAQAGCQAPARAQSAGAILAATRVPPLRVVLGPADPDGRRGVTRAPAPLSAVRSQEECLPWLLGWLHWGDPPACAELAARHH